MVDRFSGFAIVGVPFVAIRYNAFSGFWFRYGGSPSIISARERRGTTQVDDEFGCSMSKKLQFLTNCHNSQRPNVNLVSVLLPSYNLRSHPVGGSDHGGAFGVAL